MRGTTPLSQRATRVQRGARRTAGMVSTRAALTVHTVQKGESLWSIAQKQGTTLEDIKRQNYNTLGGSETIYPGQQLVIPATAKRPVPSYAKPAAAPSYSSTNNKTSVYNSYSTQAPVSSYAAPPVAAARKKNGLGLVTVGAFFIALAVGVYIFKQDEYKQVNDRGMHGGYGSRRY